MPFVGGEYRHPTELQTEHDVLIGRLERSARMALATAEDIRGGGKPANPGELEAFADLFKLTASTLRTMQRAAMVAHHAPDPGEPR